MFVAVGIAGCHLLLPHSPESATPRDGATEHGREDARTLETGSPGDAARERVSRDAARERGADASAYPDLPIGSCPGGPTVFQTNLAARRVLGQASFVDTAANRGGPPSASTLARPIGIGVHNGRLFVSDSKNHRVLVYSLPAPSGAAAGEVIGQATFTSTVAGATATSFHEPQGLQVDGAGLVVAEWSSHRVSFWPSSGTYSTSAVWGQPDALSGSANNGGLGPSSLQNPCFVLRASNQVLVADATNNRVLIFDGTVQPVSFQPALNVIGQPDLTSNASGSATHQLDFPLGVASDGTRLAIVDAYNSRLLIYNAIPKANGLAADLVWGGQGTTATTLSNPVGALSVGGRLLVADRGNSRILVFDSWPTSAAQPADHVIGQSSLSAGKLNRCGCSTASATTLNRVHFMAWDGCRLYVTDAENNRVLVY